MSELDFIRKIREQNQSHQNLILGPGDDCAVLPPRQDEQLVTVDCLMDGSHFLSQEHSGFQVGHKALAVSLSDIAAMGGVPEQVFISLSMPKSGLDKTYGSEVMRGIQNLADRYDLAIAGGDSNSWNGPLVVATTVMGRPHPRGTVYRKGAKIGDLVIVTGPLGGSIHGHHLSFEPRLQLVREILDVTSISSMIDISDGIASDLRHICHESQVSVSLTKEKIPIRASVPSSSRQQALEHALSDGEDFELCLSMDPKDWAAIEAKPFASELHVIGTVIDRGCEELYWDDGTAIMVKGFEHQF